jgi:hypothetical protein
MAYVSANGRQYSAEVDSAFAFYGRLVDYDYVHIVTSASL